MRVTLLAAIFVVTQFVCNCAVAGPLPSVDTQVRKKYSGDWIGKRLREIIPPNHIKKIIRVKDYMLMDDFLPNGYRGERASIDEAIQKGYDGLFADLIASGEKAVQDFIYSYERTRAELVICTDDNRLFFIEVIGGLRDSVSGIAVYNSEGCVRIPVTNYQPRRVKS